MMCHSKDGSSALGCLWRPVFANRPDGTYNPSLDDVHNRFMNNEHAVPGVRISGRIEWLRVVFPREGRERAALDPERHVAPGLERGHASGVEVRTERSRSRQRSAPPLEWNLHPEPLLRVLGTHAQTEHFWRADARRKRPRRARSSHR